MKKLPHVVVYVHLSAGREILLIDGIVYCGLVLHDLPRLENGDLLQILKNYIWLFKLVDL